MIRYMYRIIVPADQTQPLVNMLTPIITAAITFLAGWVGAMYGIRQAKFQKRLDFIEKQLREFYSPILGLRKEIEAKGLVRLKIKQSGDKIWETTPREILQPKMDLVNKEIEYNNKQLKEDLLPKYHKMLEIFQENIGLAEPSTLVYFSDLLEFVEIWDRWLAKSLDPEVIIDIKHDEEKLKPFYAEVEKRTAMLREELSGKKTTI